MNQTKIFEVLIGSLLAMYIFENYISTRYHPDVIIREEPSTFRPGGRRFDPVIDVKDPYGTAG